MAMKTTTVEKRSIGLQANISPPFIPGHDKSAPDADTSKGHVRQLFTTSATSSGVTPGKQAPGDPHMDATSGTPKKPDTPNGDWTLSVGRRRNNRKVTKDISSPSYLEKQSGEQPSKGQQSQYHGNSTSQIGHSDGRSLLVQLGPGWSSAFQVVTQLNKQYPNLTNQYTTTLNSRGERLILAHSQEAHNAIKGITTLAGKAVEFLEHRAKNTNYSYVIYGVPQDFESDIFLGIEGIHTVELLTDPSRRIHSYRVSSSQPQPEFVSIKGYQPFETRTFVRQPDRCTNCHLWGHLNRNCTYDARCYYCGLEPHPREYPCTQAKQKTKLCINCQGNHATAYKGCSSRTSIYRQAMAKMRRQSDYRSRLANTPQHHSPSAHSHDTDSYSTRYTSPAPDSGRSKGTTHTPSSTCHTPTHVDTRTDDDSAINSEEDQPQQPALKSQVANQIYRLLTFTQSLCQQMALLVHMVEYLPTSFLQDTKSLLRERFDTDLPDWFHNTAMLFQRGPNSTRSRDSFHRHTGDKSGSKSSTVTNSTKEDIIYQAISQQVQQGIQDIRKNTEHGTDRDFQITLRLPHHLWQDQE